MSKINSPSRLVLILGLLIGIFAVSTAAIFIRLAQHQGTPSIVIAAARLTLSSLFLAPIALIRHRSELRSLTRREIGLALLAGLFLALHFATWIQSLEYTSVASSVVLVTTTPLWVSLLSAPLLGERIGRMTAFGLTLALSGGVIIGLSDACYFEQGQLLCPSPQAFLARQAFWGDFLALFGAWMAAGYLLAGRKLRSRLALIPYVFLVYTAAAFLLVGFMIFEKNSLFGYSPIIYLWFILLALIPQLLGHTLFNWALKYAPASFVSIVLLGEPVGSSVLAILLFQEIPGALKIGGAVVLLAGIWLASREGQMTN
ncbi:MAG: DMT family transporter [Anaerolineales bacterium]|nr:DMT family transporter [Anaerolineales bacterium]MCX7609838.1 DMT family transporter [Anaerolineales bacterium]MDW8226493.1 DMT family transporter [Anaerolineales bacterium]